MNNFKCKKQGQSNLYINFYVRRVDGLEIMFHLFGKYVQGTNKNIYRVDRDRVERGFFYYIPFCVVWIFGPCK